CRARRLDGSPRKGGGGSCRTSRRDRVRSRRRGSRDADGWNADYINEKAPISSSFLFLVELNRQVIVERAFGRIRRLGAKDEAKSSPVELAVLREKISQRGVFLQLLGQFGVLTKNHELALPGRQRQDG